MLQVATSILLGGALLCMLSATADGMMCRGFNASKSTGSQSESPYPSEFATYNRFHCPDGEFLTKVDVEFTGLIESTVWTCTDGFTSDPFGKPGALDAGTGTAYFDVAITAVRVRYSASDLGSSGPPLVAAASFGGYNISPSSSRAVFSWEGPFGKHEQHGKHEKRGKHGDKPGRRPVSFCPCDSYATGVQLWEAPSPPGGDTSSFLLGMRLECAKAIGTCTLNIPPTDGLEECEDSQGYLAGDTSSSMSVPITHMGSGSGGAGFMLTPFVLGLGILLCCQRGRQRRMRNSEHVPEDVATDNRPEIGG